MEGHQKGNTSWDRRPSKQKTEGSLPRRRDWDRRYVTRWRGRVTSADLRLKLFPRGERPNQKEPMRRSQDPNLKRSIRVNGSLVSVDF